MQNAPLENALRVAQFEYDFSRDGGAIGDILLGTKILPGGAKVLYGFVDVQDVVTSGGSATIALSVTGAGDILAATAVASFSANALLDCVPDYTAANMVIVAASAQVTMAVAVAALTDGKFNVNLVYLVTE